MTRAIKGASNATLCLISIPAIREERGGIMKTFIFSASLVLGGIAVFLSGCAPSAENSDQAAELPYQDPTGRITLKNTPLTLTTDEKIETSDPAPIFTYLASVDAPQSPDAKLPVQATAFAIQDNYAYIVYNYAGETVLGALDIVDLTSPRRPQIVSTTFFNTAEFSDVKVSGRYVYMVGAESDVEEGAVFKVVSVSDPRRPVEVASVSLTGYYGTSLALERDRAYVSVADNFGVVEIDISNPEKPAVALKASLMNATFVLRYSGETLALGGDSTSIYRLAGEDFVAVADVAKGAFEAPARMKVSGTKLYTNPATSGLHIFDISNLRDVSELSNASVRGTGNGIDVVSSYAFLAQGEAGALVYNIRDASKPALYGSFDFLDDRGSANGIKYGKVGSNSLLMIADGLGGFRLLQFTGPRGVTLDEEES